MLYVRSGTCIPKSTTTHISSCLLRIVNLVLHLIFFALRPEYLATSTIEHGWDQRHPLGLSGTKSLPKEYLLIYVPRVDEELDIFERILLASIAYMTEENFIKHSSRNYYHTHN